MANQTNVVFIHGSGQSNLSFNFLEIFLPEHNLLSLEYDVQEDPEQIVKRFKFLIDQNLGDEPFSIIAHSYGCVLSARLLSYYDNVKNLFALSSPWAGSRTAKWLSLVFRQSKLFATMTPGSEFLTSIANTNSEIPITNIITAGTGSGNALAGLGSSPNDGLLTIETQTKVPVGFVNKENITVDLSHNEVLLSMDIVNLIKERVFDDYNRD